MSISSQETMDSIIDSENKKTDENELYDMLNTKETCIVSQTTSAREENIKLQSSFMKCSENEHITNVELIFQKELGGQRILPDFNILNPILRKYPKGMQKKYEITLKDTSTEELVKEMQNSNSQKNHKY